MCIRDSYHRGSLLDGRAMYLSCDTKKFHHNESTHILHNFRTSTHRGEASHPFPLAAPLHGSNLIKPHSETVMEPALCQLYRHIFVRYVDWCVRRTQVIKMLLAIVLLFAICWSPTLLDSVLVEFGIVGRFHHGYLRYARREFGLILTSHSTQNGSLRRRSFRCGKLNYNNTTEQCQMHAGEEDHTRPGWTQNGSFLDVVSSQFLLGANDVKRNGTFETRRTKPTPQF